MPTLQELLFDLGPTVLTAVVLFFLQRSYLNKKSWSRVRRHHRTSISESLGVLPLALSIGFLVGYGVLNRGVPLPTKEAADWLFWGATAMLLVIVYDCLAHPPTGLWYSGSLAVIALAICAIIAQLPKEIWTGEEKLEWWAACWAAAVVLDMSLEGSLRRGNRYAIASALFVVAVLGSLVLAMSSATMYGLKAAAIPAAIAPVILLALVFKTELTSAALAPLFVLLFGGCLLCGYLYSELKTVNAVLLFIAPLGVWVDCVPAIQERKPWQQGLVQFIVILIPACVAFGLALYKFQADMAAFVAY